MAYTLNAEKRARKQIEKLPDADRLDVLKALKKLQANPFDPSLNVKKLTARDGYRLRVGNWRVLYLLDTATQTVIVTKVTDRKETYRR